MNFLGNSLPIPSDKSFDKARQFLIDCPPSVSSNKEVLRRFITKYGDRIDAETTAFLRRRINA
ncbi:MAG: hypothetical protein Ta2A_00520 [Treponemataceae bacterium]|nr:MAG: hypothetical protein Ta2A_00520 [Treponemataceae bacterium]